MLSGVEHEKGFIILGPGLGIDTCINHIYSKYLA